MSLIQAQQKYIDRVVNANPNFIKRTRKAAWAELYRWAESKGLDAKAVCNDAKDVANLELLCNE